MLEPNDPKTFKRLLGYIKAHKLVFAIAVFFNIVYALMDLAFMMSLKPLTDKGLVAGDIEFMKMVPFYIIGLMGIRSVASFISAYCMAWVGQNIVQKMRLQLIKSYSFLPTSFFDSNSSGQLVSKVTYNTQQVASASTDAVTKVAREGGLILGSIVVLFMTSWKLAAIFFISAPIIALIVAFASKRFKKISKNIQDAMGNVTQNTQEVVDGYKVIKTFSAESFENDRFEKIANQNRRQTMKMILTKSLSTPLIQFIATLAIAAVIFFATSELTQQNISPGDFVLMMTLMMGILKPLKIISNLNNVIQQGVVAAQSVFDVIDTPKESDLGTIVLEETPQTIQFKNVSFQYESNTDAVLKDIEFEVEKGKTIALVGRSGSGKSTLTNLLLRFYDVNKGSIKFDENNIQELSLASLRKNIAYVSQQVILFDDSISANIAYASNEIDQAKLVDAATKAHALEFIEKMPQGFDTKIGENGSKLSGGQRQRLAIARAIYKDAPIIILDEATSALDTESERHIQAALDALTENRTTLVIAHRLSTIENADKIIVMDEGEIVEQGDHQSLLKLNGSYAKLHSIQFSEE